MIIKKPNKKIFPSSKLEINGDRKNQFVICKNKDYVANVKYGDNLLIKDWNWIWVTKKDWNILKKMADKMAEERQKNLNPIPYAPKKKCSKGRKKAKKTICR